MTLALTPNAEKVVADYLRTNEDVVAITDRIVTTTPATTDEPWVRYTQLNKRDKAPPVDYFNEVYIQFECYAGKEGGQPEASALSRTVRAAIMALNETDAEVDDVVVTGAEPRGDSRQPDTQLDSRERFILSFAVWMHA